MGAEFLRVAAAIWPVGALILLGSAMQRSRFPGDAFWQPAERLTYFVLLPVLIGATLAKAEVRGDAWVAMAGSIAAAIAAVFATLIALRRWLRVDGPRFTSLAQGAVRMNTYVGLSVAASLASEEGLAYAAVAIAVIVPMVNLACVATLARLGRRPDGRSPRIAAAVATNPLIVASVAGVALNATGVGAPPLVAAVAEPLSRAALPLGLLAVGASLRWEALRRIGLQELAVSAVKLLGLPALCALLLSWTGVTGPAASVAVLFTALPSAPSAYLLARQMGGDSAAMAALITLQTAAAVVTLPLAIAVLSP